MTSEDIHDLVHTNMKYKKALPLVLIIFVHWSLVETYIVQVFVSRWRACHLDSGGREKIISDLIDNRLTVFIL